MFKISLADFNTILLHAEKVSNGQIDFIEVLHDELKNKLGVEDINPLIDSLKQNDVADVQNQTRLFLAQFNFIIEDENIHYHLVKLSDKYCELDIIPETKNVESKEIIPTQNVNSDVSSTFSLTLDQRVVKIQFHLQNMANSAIIIGQELTECKKEVGHGQWLNWLDGNFGMTIRTADRFMKCAERFSNWTSMSNFNSTQLITMLALPAGEEEKFITEKAAEGNPVEDMTIKTLRAEIKNWKAQADKNKQEAQKKTPKLKIKLRRLIAFAMRTLNCRRKMLKPKLPRKKLPTFKTESNNFIRSWNRKLLKLFRPMIMNLIKKKLLLLAIKFNSWKISSLRILFLSILLPLNL